uniref:Protein RFT1 homolog n=1 Tax=Plectus sambesii TaxID=2011161 RepID=A0A914WDF2_9BILA
ASFETATSVLFGLLRVTCVLGLGVCTFGMAYSRLLLSVYGGQLLVSGTGPTMLKSYCAYVLLLALNGITECFAFATMSNDQVMSHSRFMIGSSVVYLLLHWMLSTLFGGVGFILANCANMVVRIVYSLRYIRTFYRDVPDAQPTSHLIPTASTAGILLASLLFTLLSELIFCCDGFFNSAAHVTVGAVFFLFTGLVIYSSDFALVAFAERFIFLRHKID